MGSAMMRPTRSMGRPIGESFASARVRSHLVVIAGVSGHDPAKVYVAEHDHVVEIQLKGDPDGFPI